MWPTFLVFPSNQVFILFYQAGIFLLLLCCVHVLIKSWTLQMNALHSWAVLQWRYVIALVIYKIKYNKERFMWWRKPTRCVSAPWSPDWTSRLWGRSPSSGRNRKCQSRLCRRLSSPQASRSGLRRAPGHTPCWKKAPETHTVRQCVSRSVWVNISEDAEKLWQTFIMMKQVSPTGSNP